MYYNRVFLLFKHLFVFFYYILETVINFSGSIKQLFLFIIIFLLYNRKKDYNNFKIKFKEVQNNLVIKDLGIAIKNLRIENNMTLQELSDLTKISVSYLSLLERGQSNPTISNIHRICNVFNISMVDLLASIDSDDNNIIRKEDRKLLYKSTSGVSYETLTSKKPLNAVLMTVHKNNLNISDIHTIDEFGYIISGKLMVIMDNKEYILSEGDAIYIPANTEHKFKKLCEEDCSTIWVYAPTSKIHP